MYYLIRYILLFNNFKLHRILNVTAKIGNFIRRPYDSSLPGRRITIPCGDGLKVLLLKIRPNKLFEFLSTMVHYSVPYCVGKVHSSPMVGKMINNTQRIEFMDKPAAITFQIVHNFLSDMSEGGMSEVVPQAYCPGKVGIKIKSTTNCRRY